MEDLKVSASPTYDLNWLFSVDDHVIEPRDVWTSRLPAKYKDIGPHLLIDDGVEYWAYEDQREISAGVSAAAGKSNKEFSASSLTYAEMRPGCYDSVARLADMDESGILTSVCFPSFSRFCGQTFLKFKDKELAFLCVQAYNDFMIDEWCGSAPGRFVPLIVLPLWDPKLAAKEMERCAAKGARGYTFSENPTHLGLPSIHDPNEYWEPVFNAANELELVTCTHIGSSSKLPITAPDSPAFVTQMLFGLVGPASAMTDWLFSGWFQRFPNLKLALSEGGIGWIPYVIEHSEYVLKRHRYWLNTTAETHVQLALKQAYGGGATQSHEVDWDSIDIPQSFRDHVYGCFIDDPHGSRSIEEIGVDNVMIETDYPHSDSTWPNCIEVARKQLSHLSDENAYKVLRGNAERVFRFTPAEPPSLTANR